MAFDTKSCSGEHTEKATHKARSTASETVKIRNSQFKNNNFTEMCSSSEEGWY